jgi:hypothetical protein
MQTYSIIRRIYYFVLRVHNRKFRAQKQRKNRQILELFLNEDIDLFLILISRKLNFYLERKYDSQKPFASMYYTPQSEYVSNIDYTLFQMRKL